MAELKICFWNLRSCRDVSPIAALADEHRPDILVLAEGEITEIAVAEELNSRKSRHYSVPRNRSARLKFLLGAPPDRLQSVLDSPYFAIRRYLPFVGPDVLLVAVHLPSKLHLSDEEQAMLVTRLREGVTHAEETFSHRRTVVIGDFNMNPFEAGVVGSEGLHGVMSRDVALKDHRVVYDQPRHYFYNPMWSMLGDCSPGPPGSYFYKNSGPIAYFWNMFDQVLLRPTLAQSFIPGDVAILDTVGGQSLLSPAGRPRRELSDHLPVMVRLRMQES